MIPPERLAFLTIFAPLLFITGSSSIARLTLSRLAISVNGGLQHQCDYQETLQRLHVCIESPNPIKIMNT